MSWCETTQHQWCDYDVDRGNAGKEQLTAQTHRSGSLLAPRNNPWDRKTQVSYLHSVLNSNFIPNQLKRFLTDPMRMTIPIQYILVQTPCDPNKLEYTKTSEQIIAIQFYTQRDTMSAALSQPSCLRPPRNGDAGSIDHRNKPKNHHRNISSLSPRTLSNTNVMQIRRVDVHQRHTSKATNECNELVEIAGANTGNNTSKEDQDRPESVLLPLGEAVLLTRRAAKELKLDGTHSREELHRGTDQDGHGVQELYGVDELAGLGEVGDDLDGDVLAEGAIAQHADGGEDDGDDGHDDQEQLAEVLGMLHARLDGQDEADALESEDRGADRHGPVAGVELLDGRVEAAHLADPGDVVPVDVGQAD